jgi:hypothetical protein
MSSVRQLVAWHYCQHPINFVGVVITNDILGPSRFKSNIRRSFSESEAFEGPASEREKSNTIHQSKAGKEIAKMAAASFFHGSSVAAASSAMSRCSHVFFGCFASTSSSPDHSIH